MRARAALDPPAETKRQFFTLVLWLGCLLVAVVLSAAVGPRFGADDPALLDTSDPATQAEIHRSRLARLRIALFLGILAPAAGTLLLARRHKRHGAHARGITVELTDTEMRLWGRGYGTRVPIEGSELDERLVDVYAGRLGAWRQVRLRLRDKARAVEIAARASPDDASRGLRHEGGEGDCVELDREDYEAIKAEIARRRGGQKG